MIKFQSQINLIDLLYMKKKYGKTYNDKTIASFHYLEFKKLFKNEEAKIVLGYNIYVINNYIKNNYADTISFLASLKRIMRKTRVELCDLDAQEILLLEERVFSNNRNIKVLLTNLPTVKHERFGIKFVDGKLFKIIKKQYVLVGIGELLISNLRVIFLLKESRLIFYWKKMENIKYSSAGFEFNYHKITFSISIHDNKSLNNTIGNYMPKVNNKL